MNPAVFLPPAAALLVIAVWIAPQRDAIGDIRKENEVLASHIDAARKNRSAESDRSLATRIHGKEAADEKGIDWERLAALQTGMTGGVPDVRSMVELQRKLLGMTAEELVAGLDEIAGLDLSEEVKRQLESTLIGILAQKDPQLALERFADRIGDDRGGMSWQLSHAFGKWATKDSAAAAAWMDRMIAAGKFDSKALDGKNQGRLRFEAALVKELAASDPDAAARRLASLPEDQRADVFDQGMFFNVKPGTEKAVADLIRGSLPEDQRNATLARASAQLVRQGGYEKVSTFLADIGASGEERAAIVSNTLRNQISHSPEKKTDMEETRAWIVAQAPDDAERLTGEALAHMTEWESFSDLADQALGYRQASGSDDALVAFLSNAPQGNREEIMALAEQITDPEKREQVTRRFVNNPNRTARPKVIAR